MYINRFIKSKLSRAIPPLPEDEGTPAHHVEMQLHLRSILEVKNGIGHELYEKVRGIKALAQTENRPLTRLEIEQIRESELEMERLYERAFQQSLDN